MRDVFILCAELSKTHDNPFEETYSDPKSSSLYLEFNGISTNSKPLRWGCGQLFRKLFNNNNKTDITSCPYLHKAGWLLWVQQANAQLVSSVGHLHHVKRQRFWNRQHHGNQPNQCHFHRFPQRNPHPLHPAPWSHCVVATETGCKYKTRRDCCFWSSCVSSLSVHVTSPVNAERTQAEDGDSHGGFLDERHQLTNIHTEWPVFSY